MVALYDTVAEPLDDAARAALERSRLRDLHLVLHRALPDGGRGGRVPGRRAAGLDRPGHQRHRARARARRCTWRPSGTTSTAWSTRSLADATRARVIVSLLTDYGHDDDFVGICHGVIASIAPEARDHRRDPRHPAASTCAAARSSCATRCPTCRWACTWRVVDPQVGTERRGDRRAVPATAALLVGPDNGLLSLAWERAGGVDTAVDITLLAAPARAGVRHLPRPRRVRSRGRPPGRRRELVEDAGDAARAGRAAAGRARCGPSRTATRWSRTCSYVDRFGNATLNVAHEPTSSAAA